MLLALSDRSIKIWRLARYSLDSLIRSRRSQIFVITYLAYATLYATRKPFSVVKTDVQDDLNMSTDWLGAIDTCFLAAYAVGQLLIPALLAQYPDVSASAVLLCLYGGSGFSALGFGMAESPWAFCALWTANGLLHASVFPLLVTCLTPWFSSAERGKVMGAWTTSQQTGAIAATALSAWMAAHLGWRSAFTLPGVFTAVCGAFLAWAMRGTLANGTVVNTVQPPPSEELVDDIEMVQKRLPSSGLGSSQLSSNVYYSSNTPSVAGTGGNVGSMLLVVGDPPRGTRDIKSAEPDCLTPSSKVLNEDVFINTLETISSSGMSNTLKRLSDIADVKSVSGSYFCIKCVRYSLLFWLPYYLATELRYSAEIAGYTSIIFDVGGVVGGICAGQVADRSFGGRRLYVAAVSCILAAASLVAFALLAGHSQVTALSLLAMIGITVAAADSIIGGSAASDICERAKYAAPAVGTISGLINGCGSVGAVLQGYLTSKLTQTVGWSWFYMVLATLAGFGGVCLSAPVAHEKSAAVRLVADG